MMRVIFWLACLIGLLLLCVLQSRRVLLTPQFGFVASFIPQAALLLYFIDAWDVDLCDETMWVLLSGVTTFFVVSLLCSWFYKKIHCINESHLRRYDSAFCEPIDVKKNSLILFFVFQIVVILLMLYNLYLLLPGGSLIERIVFRGHSMKYDAFGDRVNVPALLNQCFIACQQSGYIFVYLLAHSFILKYKRNRLWLWLNLAACGFNMLLTGNRGPFLSLFIAAIVQGYFIWGKATGWEKGIRIKTLFRVLGIGLLLLGALYWTMSWFGRKTDYDIVGYIGEYLAAPLKNLDTFIREGEIGHHFEYSRTFRNILNDLGVVFNREEWKYTPVNPTRYVNGDCLGNVYTAFYCYLYDGGYLGCILLTALVAFVSQNVFLKAAYGRKQPQISLVIIVYAYMFQEIAFAFFYDFFCSVTFSVGMVKNLFMWWLLREVLTKVKLVRRRRYA